MLNYQSVRALVGISLNIQIEHTPSFEKCRNGKFYHCEVFWNIKKKRPTIHPRLPKDLPFFGGSIPIVLLSHVYPEA
jgi:hypothetical protein